jgi:hypothetical protein
MGHGSRQEGPGRPGDLRRRIAEEAELIEQLLIGVAQEQ